MDCKFILTDIGTYAYGIFKRSAISKDIEMSPGKLPNKFSFKHHITRPYHVKQLSEIESVFNYGLHEEQWKIQ